MVVVSGIQAVGFDLDGTLFDHRGAASSAVDLFVSTLGVPPSADIRHTWFAAEEVEFERWRRGLSSFDEQRRSRLLTVLPTLGIEFDDAASSLDALFAQYLAAYRSAWKPFPDVLELLDSLRGRGFAVGILSNGNEEQQLEKLRAIGVADLVDAVCISEAIGVQKPDARAFEHLATKLGVTPGECLFVGDDPQQDIAGAHTAGMQTALIERYRDGSPSLAAIVDAALDLTESGGVAATVIGDQVS